LRARDCRGRSPNGLKVDLTRLFTLVRNRKPFVNASVDTQRRQLESTLTNLWNTNLVNLRPVEDCNKKIINDFRFPGGYLAEAFSQKAHYLST